jgi:hypothetical protein
MRAYAAPASGMVLACLALILAGARLGTAGEARLAVDPRQDLAGLARPGQVAVSVERRDGVYRLDASAVLHADQARVLQVSVDYDRYPRMGMPHLRAMRVVSTASEGDLVHAWTWMSCLGQASKHYLAIRIRRELGPGRAAAIEWTLTRRQPGWPYAEAPAFARLDGWWYLEAVGDGETYVRYGTTAVLDPAIPEAVLGWLVTRQLGDGARGIIETVARHAALRP